MQSKLKFACQTMSWKDVVKENPELVMRDVSDAGYQGIEFAPITSLEHLRDMAIMAARYGLRMINVHPPSGASFESVDYNVVLGNDFVEIKAAWKHEFGGRHPSRDDYRAAICRLQRMIHYVRAHGLVPIHHVHLGAMMETEEDIEQFLSCSSDLYLLLDTGHLCAAGGDPVRVIKTYPNRIGHVHLKDFYAEDPATWSPWDNPNPWEHARFAELGQGNIGLDVEAVLQTLVEIEYHGWVSVELDHPQEPEPAHLRRSRKYISDLGY